MIASYGHLEIISCQSKAARVNEKIERKGKGDDGDCNHVYEIMLVVAQNRMLKVGSLSLYLTTSSKLGVR